MTFDQVFAEAKRILQQNPLPPDAVARFRALEAQLDDETELQQFGDLWEALQAASAGPIFDPPDDSAA